MYRIVTLDGGGVHCLLTAILLRRLEEARPGLLESVDMFAGTSGGAVMAVLLASRANPAEMIESCVTLWERAQVFERDPGSLTLAALGLLAFYDNGNLKRFLTGHLGERRLGQLDRQVCITALDLDDRGRTRITRRLQPQVFHNFPGDNGSLELPAVDAALRSSAAPISFPIYQGYVDGSLFAGNPAMFAAASALDELVRRDASRGHRDYLPELAVLSLGAGHNAMFVDAYNESWGWGRWLLDIERPLLLLNVYIEANNEAVDAQARLLLGEKQYLRVNPTLEYPVPYTDSGRAVSMLKRVANTVDLTPILEWLDSSSWRGGPGRPGLAPSPAR